MCARPVSVTLKSERFKENIALSLHYVISINEGRRESLIDEPHNG